MTQVAERETREILRAIAFVPSGREDYLGSARMSFEDYLRLDYEGGLSEWVDGEARIYMSNTDEHQRVIEFLVTLLSMFTEVTGVGLLKTAPYAMRAAAGGSGREPDLMFVRREHFDRVRRSHLVGTPDLVVEIVSDESGRRDREEKFREYEAAGIPEYWIIDPRPSHETASFFVLRDGHYEQQALVNGAFSSTVIDGFFVRPEWFWEPEPRPLAAFEAITGRKLV